MTVHTVAIWYSNPLVRVQKLIRVFRWDSRVNGVVPLGAGFMAAKGNLLELGLAHAHTGRVLLLEMNGGHFQPRGGRRAANESQEHAQRGENIAGPGCGDLTEQPMFDGIPFRGARWIVADGDLATGVIGEFLQAFFEHPRPRTVAAAAIGFNH